jgi:hypothetical protein
MASSPKRVVNGKRRGGRKGRKGKEQEKALLLPEVTVRRSFCYLC